MARFDDEAELFAEDFQAGYVKNLLRLQQEVIKIPGQEEHYDIYLARQLYPVLLPGIELLAREIDRLTNKENQGKYKHTHSTVSTRFLTLSLRLCLWLQTRSTKASVQGSTLASSWPST